MNLVELDQALRKLRLSGMADVLETRLLQAQAEQMAPIDLVAALVTDELQRRQDRLLARRHKQARFRDPERSLDGFISPRPSAAPRSSRATASSYREAHAFLEELAEATLAETRKDYLTELTRVPLLIIDDLGMRKLPHTAAEDLLELIMRRYERASTVLTSNRPVEDWGKLLGDTAVVTALLDRLLHHAHVLKCGPRSWRTRVQTTLPNTGRREVELNSRLGTPEMAGFAVSTKTCIIHEGPDSTAKGRDRRRNGSRTSPPASGAGV